MIELERVYDTSHDAWRFLTECYAHAFPEAERRSVYAFEALLVNSQFYCYVILSSQQPVGLLTIWQLGEFRYVEHFAVDELCRGQNIGGRALLLFLQQSDLPVILEVEPPLDEQSSRRVRFYEKAGFRLSHVQYIQPPYSPLTGEVELRLMEWNGNLLDEHFEMVKNSLYKNVYGVSINYDSEKK